MQNGRLQEIGRMVEQLQVVCSGSHIDVSVASGRNEGTTLWSEKELSIHVWSADAGTVFPKHSHKESEWIIISKGEMRIRVDSDDFSKAKRYQMVDGYAVIREGDYIFIPANIIHQANFNMETEYVTVHVPRSLDYAPGTKK